MLSRENPSAPAPAGGFLADDMGLGKTHQAIAVICKNPIKYPTLIVTEVATLAQWRDALITFGNIKPAILNASFKPTTLPHDISLVLTTYSVFQRPNGAPQSLKNQRWGRIILDEGHNISNPRTKLYKEISLLTADIKWILSATPIQNSEKDIQAQARWIGIPSNTDLEDIYNTYLLRRTQKDNLELPPLDSSIISIPFKYEEEKELYEQVQKHYSDKLFEIKTQTSKANMTALEGMLVCRQICISPDLFYSRQSQSQFTNKKRKLSSDDSESSRSASPSTKIEYLVDYVKTINLITSQKVLIFCSWRQEMQLISEALKKEDIESLIFDGQLSREQKENTLYNYINTSIPVLILQVKCGSTGLNLQCATHVIITTPNWNPTIDLQAIGRSYRKGQTQPVKCIRLVMQNTIEEKCLKISETKASFIADTMKDTSIVNRLGTNPPQFELTTAEIYELFNME